MCLSTERNLAKEADVERLRQEVGAAVQQINEKRETFDQKVYRQQEILKVRDFARVFMNLLHWSFVYFLVEIS